MKVIPLARAEEKPKNALSYILDAWDEATLNGVKSDSIATAALFTAISSLVDTHGEEAVAALTARLSDRVRRGEFTMSHNAH